MGPFRDVSRGGAYADGLYYCRLGASEGAFRCSDGEWERRASPSGEPRLLMRLQCNEHQGTYGGGGMVRGAHAQQQRSSSKLDLLSHRLSGSGATGAPPRRALDTRIRGLAGARDARHPPGRRSLRWIALSQCAVDSGRRSEDQRGSGDLENGLALSCRLAGLSDWQGWRDRAGRGSRAREARIGSRHLTELTAMSADSRCVFCLARPAAAGKRHVSTEVRWCGRMEEEWGVGAGELWFVPILGLFSHATPCPPSPRPSPHSAGQPQAKKSVRSLNQPSLPRLWPLPSTDPCRPGTWRTLQQGWGPFPLT